MINNFKGCCKRKMPKEAQKHFYHSTQQHKVLKMYNQKTIIDGAGKIIKDAPFQSTSTKHNARIHPSLKWFTNTRTIKQMKLQEIHETQKKLAEEKEKGNYSVLMNKMQLPMQLLMDTKTNKRDLNFSEAYLSKKRDMGDYADILKRSARLEKVGTVDDDPDYMVKTQHILKKGTSNRIYTELYKVLDSSDIILHVLDARDPLGTYCESINKYLSEKTHKHLVFILNKTDLIPTFMTKQWIKYFSRLGPTIAFHAHPSKSFGKGALIQLLRQYVQIYLKMNRQQLSVGIVGFPNTGKSSIINTLRGKKVCVVAPIAGETKVWQYITLMKKIYLIDCPGIVYNNQTDSEVVLKGCCRVEQLDDPMVYIPDVLKRVKKEYLLKTYGLVDFKNAEDLLTLLGKKTGKLLKGGVADMRTVSVMVLNDFTRGKIPWFMSPPKNDDQDTVVKVMEQEEGIQSEEAKTLHVDQKFSKIKVRDEFQEDASVDEKEEELVDWDDVFKDMVGDSNQMDLQVMEDDPFSDDDSVLAEDAVEQVKQIDQSGNNFYDRVSAKNRNRPKMAHSKQVHERRQEMSKRLPGKTRITRKK
eukprot:NODE_653_length_5514_cov_0.694552.p1 type:complete len:583 gc:universal NODE_653_length_5514_cov_0.694552:2247-499(-)